MDLWRRDNPRSFALTSSLHTQTPGETRALVFRYAAKKVYASKPTCVVEFLPAIKFQIDEYKKINIQPVSGCLGLIHMGNDVFLSVITSSSYVGDIRPGESVNRILSVEFYCLSGSTWDDFVLDVNGHRHNAEEDLAGVETTPTAAEVEHPCHAIRKMVSNGKFYFSSNFDITRSLRSRVENPALNIDTADVRFLWNNYLISPLLQFRSNLDSVERKNLDECRFLAFSTQGYVGVQSVPIPGQGEAQMSLLSKLSWKRAGARFLSRGLDDNGDVSTFVETETIFSIGTRTFSYVQVRGSVPIFWEQPGMQVMNQKIQITRGPEATQPAFERHFQDLIERFTRVHAIDLLGLKENEAMLTGMYQFHMDQADFGDQVTLSHYDFNTETKEGGYEIAKNIRNIPSINTDISNFMYTLAEKDDEKSSRDEMMLKQNGIFRVNCLDCLDRTNVIQDFLSLFVLQTYLEISKTIVTGEFVMRHSYLWAENGDALSKILAGTGALKSSFTRKGKMTFAGMISDATKSVNRFYINNFSDKGKQEVMDSLLGRLVDQQPIILFDPIGDYVQCELEKYSQSFTSRTHVEIFIGTYNIGGSIPEESLDEWLQTNVIENVDPKMYIIGVQELVELTPTRIISADPESRMRWENAILTSLNKSEKAEYVMLCSGQLVGTMLVVIIKANFLENIRHVESSTKKTGLRGMAGNKGAVAIRFDYNDTSMCFVTAHLAAGHSAIVERNNDFTTISGLKFQRGRKIADHDVVIWLGDFNYRIELPNEQVRQMTSLGDLKGLYENDQLSLQMQQGKAFQGYSEGKLTFLPTYKYDIGTDIYDTSEKQRIPSWTDRIIYRGSGLTQILYGRAELYSSDHRPVFSCFQVQIKIIDWNQRDQIRAKLHAEAILHVPEMEGRYVSEILQTLPPPSTDEQQWWNDIVVTEKQKTGKRNPNVYNPFDEQFYLPPETEIRRPPPPPPQRNTKKTLTESEKTLLDEPIPVISSSILARIPPAIPARPQPLKKTTSDSYSDVSL